MADAEAPIPRDGKMTHPDGSAKKRVGDINTELLCIMNPGGLLMQRSSVEVYVGTLWFGLKSGLLYVQ